MTKLLTRSLTEARPACRPRNPAGPISKRAGQPPARPASAAPPQPPSVRCIRERAYFIYLERGGRPGDAAQDWLQAERELWAAYRGALDAYMGQNSLRA